MEPLSILLGLLVPAAAAAVLFLATRAPPARRWLGPAVRRTLAIGGAHVTGYLIVAGWPGLPPSSATGWILWLVVSSAAAACALTAPAFPAARQRFVACAAAAGIPALLLRPLFANAWSPPQGVTMLIICSLACLGGWFASLPLERGTTPGPFFGHLALCAGAAAAVIALAGSLGLARMAGALAAGTAVVAVAAQLLDREERGAGSSVLFLGILASILAAAAAYADLPWWSAACLWLAPLAGWAARLPPCAGLHGWRQAALVLGVSAALIGPPFIAALLATLAMQGE
jgi:hypothetical protein